jgi:hypothetical protein
MPKKGLRFFKGMPLLPPRAGQTARIFLLSIKGPFTLNDYIVFLERLF